MNIESNILTFMLSSIHVMVRWDVIPLRSSVLSVSKVRLAIGWSVWASQCGAIQLQQSLAFVSSSCKMGDRRFNLKLGWLLFVYARNRWLYRMWHGLNSLHRYRVSMGIPDRSSALQVRSFRNLNPRLIHLYLCRCRQMWHWWGVSIARNMILLGTLV